MPAPIPVTKSPPPASARPLLVCSPKGGATLYAILLGVPENGEALIEALGTARNLLQRPIQQVDLLGSERPVTWTREDVGLRVSTTDWAAPAAVLRIR